MKIRKADAGATETTVVTVTTSVALTFGVLDCDALAACIDEHLDGRAKHTKLMRQLLTHDAWVRCFGISGTA